MDQLSSVDRETLLQFIALAVMLLIIFGGSIAIIIAIRNKARLYSNKIRTKMESEGVTVPILLDATVKVVEHMAKAERKKRFNPNTNRREIRKNIIGIYGYWGRVPVIANGQPGTVLAKDFDPDTMQENLPPEGI